MLVKPDKRSELVTLQEGKPEKRTRSQRIRKQWELREGRIVPASEGRTGFLHMSLKFGTWESRRKAQTLVQCRARHQCRGSVSTQRQIHFLKVAHRDS